MPYLFVLLGNLAAFLPVWLGHWSVFALVSLYWFENVATGVLQFLKLRAVERVQGRDPNFPMSSFFAVHYGIFTAVHGVFVLVFFGFVMSGGRAGGAALWWLSALAVSIGPILEYRRRFLHDDEAARASQDRLMFEPYGRVVVLHLVVLVGAWLALATQQPRYALLLLIGLKLAVELFTAHRAVRRAATTARLAP